MTGCERSLPGNVLPDYPHCCLKPGRESSIEYRHPWIFSRAVKGGLGDLQHGGLVLVVQSDGTPVGTGTISTASSISVRILEFSPVVIDACWFVRRFKESDAKRRLAGYGPGTDTNGYRVVFGEADRVPGLVVDRYGEVLVIQISTAGMDRLKGTIVEALKTEFNPESIWERSDIGVRGEENLPEVTGLLYGRERPLVDFTENGIAFVADIASGQKTGFFFDQKCLRLHIRDLAGGKRALDLFSYSGAAGINALAGGAQVVRCVDSSQTALDMCERNMKLNDIAPRRYQLECADVFQWLNNQQSLDCDLAVVDPPALIKNRKSAASGKKAYHFINRAVLRLLKDGDIFVTSSCSHFMKEDEFGHIINRASIQAGCRIDLLKVVNQSPDHPLALQFPESRYLKSFVGVVRKT